MVESPMSEIEGPITTNHKTQQQIKNMTNLKDIIIRDLN